MRHVRLAGRMWLLCGIVSSLLVLATLDVPGIAVLVAVSGIVGIVIGGLLIRRPSATVVRLSSIAGVGWLLAFGWLTVYNLTNPPIEWLTVLVLAALGVFAALLSALG